MNDFLTPDTPSTVIDNNAPVPGSAEFRPDPLAPEVKDEPKPMSLDEAMKQAVADTKADKTDDKAKPEKVEAKVDSKEAKPKVEAEEKVKPAPERGENGKFTAKPKAETESLTPASSEEDGDVEQEQGGQQRPSEGRDVNRAPAQFLPRAKEKWGTVDADVRGEVHRTIANLEKGIEQGREDRQFRSEIRHFEDMAKEAGTTVKAALENYVGIDKLLRENPVAGIERILKSIDITPQQYAQHVIGQAQQQRDNPALAQTNQLQSQIQQLQSQIQQLTQGTQQDREAARLAEVERTIIAPFIAEHPRYKELEGDIAFFLNSGKIPSNLSEQDRLETAYDMAERINPTGHYSPQEPLNPAPHAQRPLNPAGSKSVKGSPTYGAEVPRKSAKLSLDESIKAAMAANRL